MNDWMATERERGKMNGLAMSWDQENKKRTRVEWRRKTLGAKNKGLKKKENRIKEEEGGRRRRNQRGSNSIGSGRKKKEGNEEEE